MKKFAALLFALAALCGLLGLSACDSTEAKEHNWGEWTVETPATCTKEGVEKRVCLDGDGETETRPIPKTDHTAVVREGVPATCTEDGLSEGTYCSVCNTVLTEQTIIPAFGHKWGPWTSNGDHKTHTQVCEHDQTHINTEDCEYIEVVTHPTCTEPGYSTFACTACYDSYRDKETEELGHDYTGEWLPSTTRENYHYKVCSHDPTHLDEQPCELKDTVVKPTCEEGGYTRHTCSLCSNTFDDAFTDKTDHKWGIWQYLDGDIHYRTCENDPEHIQRGECENDVTVHEPTCTEGGYTLYGCDICKHGRREEGEPATGHRYGDAVLPCPDDPGHHYRACLNAPEDPEHYEISDCELTESTVKATCTTPGYTAYSCAACSYSCKGPETPALTHDWTDWQHSDTKIQSESMHTRRCTREECGETEEKPCDFDPVFTAPTCEAFGYYTYTCKDCEYHWENYRDEDDQPYSPTGHVYGNTYTDNGDGTHSRTCTAAKCGHVETSSCRYPEKGVEKEATCTEGGYVGYTCSDCSHVDKRELTDPIPHSYSQWRQVEGQTKHTRSCTSCGDMQEENCRFSYETVAPTCTDPGYTIRTCDTCRDVDHIDPKDELGHDYGDWTPVPGLVNGKHTHQQICQRSECKNVNTGECTMKTITGVPTCTTPGDNYTICEKCRYSEDLPDTSALNHLWTSWTKDNQGHHYRVCQRQGCEGGENGAPAREEFDCDYEVSVQDVTCEADGVRKSVCSDCGYTKTETLARALGHNWDGNGGEGWKPKDSRNHTRTCLRCGETQDKACNFSTNIVKPTCETDGYTDHTCPDCSNTYRDGQKNKLGHDYSVYEPNDNGTHTIRCKNDNTHTISGNCEYGAERRVDPTCTTDGYTAHTCTKCSYEETYNKVDKLNHKYGAWQKNTAKAGYHYRICEHDNSHREEIACSNFNTDVVKATCTTDGYTTKTCRDCNYSFESAHEDQLGHLWKVSQVSTNNLTHFVVCQHDNSHTAEVPCDYNVVETPATCEGNGYHTHTCIECGHSYTDEETGPTGHSWNKPVFNAEAQTHTTTCSKCGSSTTDKCTFTEGEVVEAKCLTAGYTVMTCSECQGTYRGKPVAAPGHDWNPFEPNQILIDRHSHSCKVCGAYATEPCSFTEEVVGADCEHDGYSRNYCTVCQREKNRTSITKLGHTMESQWTYTGDKTSVHTHQLKCTRANCGHTETGTCEFINGGTEATCGNSGLNTTYCKTCLYVKDSQVVDALQHDLSAWIPTHTGSHFQYCQRTNCNYRVETPCQIETQIIPATCTEPQKTVKKCAFCNEESVEISTEVPNGHSWRVESKTADKHVVVCNLCEEQREGKHEYGDTNFCICGWDGLTYEIPEKTAYAIVKNDNNVLSAKHITVADTYDGYAVQYIGMGAFMNNQHIETVVLPKSITKLDRYAFSNCYSLRSVSFSGEGKDSLTDIDEYAFLDCRSLTDIAIPQSLITIGEGAFERCSALMSISIPDSVTKIGSYAFRNSGIYSNQSLWKNDAFRLGNHLLKVRAVSGTFTIDSGIISVGDGCFEGLASLNTVTIAETVTYFGTDAFKGCTGISTVVYHGNVEGWLSIEFANDLASPMHYATALNIDGAEPNVDGTKTLDLTKYGKTITAIPAGTFRGVGGIEKIILPDTVTEIGANAFDGCSDLKTIEVRGTLTFIGPNAFDNTAFYSTEDNWDKGILYLTGKAVSGDGYDHEYYLIETRAEGFESDVTVRAGTKIICASAFSGRQVNSVVIPDTVRYIGDGAFVGTGVKSATFQGSVRFFCYNTLGIGRTYDNGKGGALGDPSIAAHYLNEYCPGYWNRVA